MNKFNVILKKKESEKSKLEQKISTLSERASIHNFKSDYIGCKNCGSKLKISLVKGENCPLCENTLINANASFKLFELRKAVSDINQDIKSLNYLIYYESAFAEGKLVSLTDKKLIECLERLGLDLYPKEFTEIMSELAKRYNDSNEKINAYYATNPANNEIVVICRDFNHSKKYFSAWYDILTFKPNGSGKMELVNIKKLSGTTYSSFSIEGIEWNAKRNVYVIKASSYMAFEAYSKCDDKCVGVFEYYSSTNSLISHPFIFIDRISERDYGDPYEQSIKLGAFEYKVLKNKPSLEAAYKLSLSM